MFKVVLVDDEPVIRKGLRKLLDWDELGLYIAGEAGNGFEAMDVIRAEDPEIVILDIRMPGMDGIQTLKSLREAGIDSKVIVLSGYDSFKYVKDTMLFRIENYLLKPVNAQELQSTLLNIIDGLTREETIKAKRKEDSDVLKNNIFGRLITNQIAEDELQERLDFLGIRLSGRFFTTAVIEMLGAEALSPPKEKAHDQFSFQSIISSSLPEDCVNIFFRDLSGHVVVLFCLTEDNTEIIRDALQTSITHIVHDLKQDVLIYLGRKVKELSSVHLSYNDALSLADYKYFNIKNRLIDHSEEIEKNNASNDLFNVDITRFETLLINCDQHEVSVFLDDLFNKCLKTEGVRPDHIKAIGIQMIILLMKVVRKLKLSESDISIQNSLVDKVMDCGTAKNLLDLVKSLCIKLMVQIAYKKSSPAGLIDEILLYINENYAEEMSLKTLAAKFGVTPSYLGHKFKMEANDIFTDYLNKLRVEKARELLMNTQEKASEIANKVGYNDPNYFYKIFKKYTGIYPSEFRMNK